MADEAMHRCSPWIDPDVVVDTHPLLPVEQRDRCVTEAEADAGWHLALGDHGDRRLLPLDRAVMRVGRSTQCEVRIDHRSVAPQHAVLAARREGYLLFVDSPAWRTFVNGRRITDTVLLHDYDIVILGEAMLVARLVIRPHGQGAAPLPV
jgi:hypothetical protein